MKNEQVKMIRNLLKCSNGRIFYVEFIKRTDGTLRKMTARLGVAKGLKGGTKSFSDVDKQLITVFDMDKASYRSIALENIKRISINGLKIEQKI